MKLAIEIKDEDVQNALHSAFDAGIAYWAMVGTLSKQPEGAEYASEYPMHGGWVQLALRDPDESVPQPKRLDYAALERAVVLMAEKHPQHFAAMIGENGDATTGDVLVQLAVFGDIVFG